MIVTFRTDASLQIGSGHVMRCLTLADELKKAGAKITFITRDHPGNLNQLIENKGYNLEVLSLPSIFDDFQADSVNPRSEYLKWLGVPELKDASETIAKLEKNKPSWLIVDHYGLGLEWELALRPHIEKLMVIDDLADRKHDCDVLLDQNLVKDMNIRYHGLVPKNSNLLIGPEFAIIRPEFPALRSKSLARRQKIDIKKLFVFMGGSDPDNEVDKIIKGLKLSKKKWKCIDVIVGQNFPFKDALRIQLEGLQNSVLHIQSVDIAKLMVAADLAITGGGSTTWEKCTLGLPSLVIALGKNQKPIAKMMNQKKAQITLGSSKNVSSQIVANVLDRIQTHELQTMVNASSNICDGMGVDKILKFIKMAV